MIPTSNDMRVEISTNCNYKCVFCPHHKLIRKKENMSLDLFKFIFDKIHAETDQYDTLSFPGMGEPFLNKDIVAMIAHATQKKPALKVLILTNGSALTPQKFKELEDVGVTSVRVSFYGNTSETYSEVMGIKNSDMFKRVSQNLVEISKMKRKAKLLLTMNIVSDDFNEKKQIITQEWIKFWESKVDLVEVWRPHNWVDAVQWREVQDVKLHTCGRPFNGPLQVQVDGTVNMCCFDYDGELELGDLKTQSLREIFSSPMFMKIVECHTSGDFKGSGLICENCDQRNSDKSDVMVYNSKFNIDERVKATSTTYDKLATDEDIVKEPTFQ